LFCAFIVRRAFRRKPAVKSDSILIVNTCLVGEFAASAPAMHEIIRRSKGGPVDLLVSPPLKSLAQHMKGVRTVYTAQSVFKRESERGHDSEIPLGQYGHAIVMRISPDAYRMLGSINIACIKTGLSHFVKYGIHMGWNLLRGKTPKSWREINFNMVGEPQRHIPFDEIFSFSSAEYECVETLPALQTVQKKIFIHTGPSLSTNHWNADEWVELIKKLHEVDDFRFIFVGAKKDEDDYQYIYSRLPFQIYSLIGQINLVELALALRTGDYFIGVDSGPRNLAHLVDLPSITLLGPGPHMYTPPNPRDIVIDRSGGHGLYQRFFYKGKNRFIDHISPQDVYGAFISLLSTPC